jgi:NAD(P)-dependent dehydrogenase (short-subunit alcohol dehydrogenase family)
MQQVNSRIELRDTGIKVNSVDPGFTATDLNQHRGYQTVEQGAAAAVRLAMLSQDGPTGGFFSGAGRVPWDDLICGFQGAFMENETVGMKNKIAIITGGSRGIGRNTAVNLARRGADVIFTYRSNETEASSLIREFEAMGRKAAGFALTPATRVPSVDSSLRSARRYRVGDASGSTTL